MNVKHWLQEPIVLPMWKCILIIIMISIVGFVVRITILNKMDTGGLKKTIAAGSCGTNVFNNLAIPALCRSSKGQPTNGDSKRPPLILTASSITKELEIFNPCSYTSLLEFVKYFGKDQVYLTRSKKWWRKYLKKPICA